MRAALSCALVALTFTSAAATYPTSSEDVSSALLTVWRRHPAHHNDGQGPAISVSKARYDCATSKMAGTWTDLKRYLHVHFRSYTDGFREYVPPPPKLDQAGFHRVAESAQEEAPLQRRSPLGTSGRAGAYASSGSSSTSSSSDSGTHLSKGAIVGIIVGIVALALICFTLAFACRSGRRKSRPTACEYLRKTPTWKTEHAYSQSHLTEQPVARHYAGQGSLLPASWGEVDRPVTPPPEVRVKRSEGPKVPEIRVS